MSYLNNSQTTLARQFGGRRGRLSLARVAVPLLSTVLVFGTGLFAKANAQVAREGKPIRVTAEGALSSYWGVLGASYSEQFTGTVGYLEVKNVSETRLRAAIFYGEYFDVQGRQCFTSVFSLKENDSVNPRESREIFSIDAGLFPAVEPYEMRLHLVQVELPDQPDPVRKWAVRLHAPVIVESAQNGRLQLGSDFAARSEPVLDVMLARVNVDKSGEVKGIDILNCSASQVEAWFRQFVEQEAEFFPASDRGTPEGSQALVLVRVGLAEKGGPEIFSSPKNSPWVKAYVVAAKGVDLPPLTTFMFTRGAKDEKPKNSSDVVHTGPLPPGLFELAVGMSDWSAPAVRWVTDSEMPHRLRREVGLVKPQ